MARNWKKEFDSQFTKKGNVFTHKETGQKLSKKEYLKLYRDAQLANKKIQKPWNESEGVNPAHWWKSPWLINRLTNSDVIDPENPNRYLNMAEYQKYLSNMRRDELEVQIAQAKMNKANEDSFKPGGINYKEPEVLSTTANPSNLKPSSETVESSDATNVDVQVAPVAKDSTAVKEAQLKDDSKSTLKIPNSDVFTRVTKEAAKFGFGEEGDFVGVLTKNRRKHFESLGSIQDNLKIAQNTNDLRIYKNSRKGTTYTAGG
tara:strand:+ start:1433 stop:2212 length:780 start_codon:yes stop_codon:yes gene_type:complete